MSAWSDEEIEVLKVNWATTSAEDMRALLPRRSRFAIIGKADRLSLPGVSDDERMRRIRDGLSKGEARTRARIGGKYDPWRAA